MSKLSDLITEKQQHGWVELDTSSSSIYLTTIVDGGRLLAWWQDPKVSINSITTFTRLNGAVVHIIKKCITEINFFEDDVANIILAHDEEERVKGNA